MNIKFKIKKGDEVIVLAGKDKGKKGKIVKVLPKINKAIVSDVNKLKNIKSLGIMNLVELWKKKCLFIFPT